MRYNPDIHHRRSIRLRNYDYSSCGAYFVTICTLGRVCLFWHKCDPVGAGSKPALLQTTGSKPDLVSGQPGMVMNDFGMLVDFTWHDLPKHNKNVHLDEFIVMPNHIHGIIVIDGIKAGLERAGLERAGLERAGLEPAPTLWEIIRQFKTFSSRRINELRGNAGCPLWQRNYYERVIRDDEELRTIREYIRDNPAKWAEDKENPDFG